MLVFAVFEGFARTKPKIVRTEKWLEARLWRQALQRKTPVTGLGDRRLRQRAVLRYYFFFTRVKLTPGFWQPVPAQ